MCFFVKFFNDLDKLCKTISPLSPLRYNNHPGHNKVYKPHVGVYPAGVIDKCCIGLNLLKMRHCKVAFHGGNPANSGQYLFLQLKHQYIKNDPKHMLNI